MAERKATRPLDPPRTTITPEEVATAVATRARSRIPQRFDAKESVPTEALEALVQEIADATLSLQLHTSTDEIQN